MKTCNMCKVEKADEEFSRSTRTRDGLEPRCRACRSIYVAERYKKNPEKYREQGRAWKDAHRDTYRKYQRAWWDAHPGIASTYIAKYNAANPEKRAAHIAVMKAKRKGVLPKPSTLQCAACSEVARDYHHSSYEPEHWLDVIPLCHKCHVAIHLK